MDEPSSDLPSPPLCDFRRDLVLKSSTLMVSTCVLSCCRRDACLAYWHSSFCLLKRFFDQGIHVWLLFVPETYALFLVSAPIAPLAPANARLMLLYASYKTQKGNHTQSILKKTRYTQRCMKLLVSRFEFPLSHSGAKVMKPKFLSYCSP